MPRESLIALEGARSEYRRLVAEGASTEELDAALDRYVEAEKAHDRKLGIPVAGNPFVATVLPLILLVVLVIAAAVGISNSTRISDTVDGICERGNASRPVTVSNLQNDVSNLRAEITDLRGELRLLEAAGETQEITDAITAKRLALNEKRNSLKEKRTAITEFIAAQASEAIEPGSVIVSC